MGVVAMRAEVGGPRRSSRNPKGTQERGGARAGDEWVEKDVTGAALGNSSSRLGGEAKTKLSGEVVSAADSSMPLQSQHSGLSIPPSF